VPGQARAVSSVGDVPPTRRCSFGPAGQPPSETQRGGYLCGSRCRERYQPIGARPRRIRSAVWFRARCSLRATSLGRVARSPSCCGNREHHGCCGGSYCGAAAQKPNKIKTVAVLRGQGGAHRLTRSRASTASRRRLVPSFHIPRHGTRSLRSSTLAWGPSPSRSKARASATRHDGGSCNRP
jgi:hypothetical protein